MNNADEYATSKHIDRKPLIAVAREAVQTAEDARAIAVKKMDEIALARRTPGFSGCAGEIAGTGRRGDSAEGASPGRRGES